jgi:subtilisin family serine protease
VVIVAAGNDGINNDNDEVYPANFHFDNMITVAASKRDRDLWKDSSYGERNVTLAAPGTTIWGLWSDKKWYRSQGTSFATPVVAGAVGLLRSAHPHLTAKQVVDIFKATVTPSRFLKGKVKTGGVLNLAAAVKCANASDLPCIKKQD